MYPSKFTSTSLKIAIKQIFAFFCHRIGFFRRTNSLQPYVLMYHRFMINESINHFIQSGMYVRTKTFEKHLFEFHQHFKIFSLPELIVLLEQGQFCTGSGVLTFDDGWLDNYTQAFPLLKKYQIPATIFLTTGYIGTDRTFWPEELIFFLSQPGGIAFHESDLLHELNSQITTKPDSELYYDEAVDLLKKWTPEKRESLLSYLRESCPSPPPQRQMMNWDEVKEMHDSGLVTFGAHTANHIILDQVPLEEAEREIMQSKNDIIEYLCVVPEYFAYPNGNYTPEIKELLKKHGFKAAFTTKKGKITQDIDLFETPRIGMHDDVSNTVPMFLARIFFKWF